MTRFILITGATCTLLTIGCHAPHPTEEHDAGTAEVNWLNDSAIENAIIAQRTLYPYHFIPDAPSVNELGERDLNVLIEHFKSHPGRLNVRRGPTSEDLYQARVNFVVERMFHAGVKLGPIEDGSPGGDGMAGERVLTVLERSYAGEQDIGGGTSDGSPTAARSAAVNRGS